MQVVKQSAAAPTSPPLEESIPRWLQPAWRSIRPFVVAGWRPVQRYGEPVLAAATVLAILAAVWMAFKYAPTDALQGDVQRIEYFHVAIAWVAFLAFFVVFGASLMYLWRRDERWDWMARSAAEIGTVFTTLVLITGSLWGHIIWGAWWAWDARLTTTLILWFIYVGYLLLRSYTGRSEGGARAAAVLGIVGFIDVPIDYLSVTWWRTLHPSYQVPLGQQAQAPASVVSTLLVAVLAFTLLYTFLMLLVYRLQRAQSMAQRLRARIELE
ncbi:MAG TPA: cytochrome c biogenesis protein CcsA [Ktedonobacterales bacterium]